MRDCVINILVRQSLCVPIAQRRVLSLFGTALRLSHDLAGNSIKGRRRSTAQEESKPLTLFQNFIRSQFDFTVARTNELGMGVRKRKENPFLEERKRRLLTFSFFFWHFSSPEAEPLFALTLVSLAPSDILSLCSCILRQKDRERREYARYILHGSEKGGLSPN